jgi:hypothetical protein
MFRSLTLSAPLVVAASFAQAVDAPPAMRAFVETEVMSWASAPEVISAVTAQNAQTAGSSEAQILELDGVWRAQVGQADQPLISEVMGRDLSHMLKQKVEASGGRITEIFVMDAVGLNVAASDVTSDYWQGDEAKFKRTFGASQAVFVDEPAFDRSSGVYAIQVSVLVSDGPVQAGAMTLSLRVSRQDVRPR